VADISRLSASSRPIPTSSDALPSSPMLRAHNAVVASGSDALRRVGKGAFAPCPPSSRCARLVGTPPPSLVQLLRMGSLCPPYSLATWLSVPAAPCARVLQIHSAPKKRGRSAIPRGTQRDPQERAQGRPGARCTRGLACQDAHSKKRTRAYRFSGSSPAFPAQWFYSLFRALPGETWLVCHRRPQEARAPCELDTSHWGVRTTRLCRTLQPRSSVAALASTAPRPNVSDDGQRPLSRDGMRKK
jgi:hypothetical protein